MALYVMLTRLHHLAIRSPAGLEELEKQAMARIESECPQVEWVVNLAVGGPYDYVDVFEAPDTDTAMKVSVIVRTFGHADTEIWPAKQWMEFKEMIRSLPTAES